MIRLLVLLALLASFSWWLDREHQAGRFQRVDELFLDFLVANARERFEKPEAATVAPSVVWVKMRSADRAEYAGWPPQPLDWQMVLKGLQSFDPAVVVIPETLTWGGPSPEFAREAALALMPFPSTVFGVESQLAASRDTPGFLGGLEDEIPVFQKVQGAIDSVPSLGALIAAPDELMRRQGELGIATTSRAGETLVLPYAVQEGGNLRPTVLAQALARYTRTPYITHRLLLGPGAGAYLSRGLFVPLSASGEFAVDVGRVVPEVDALDLMTGEVVGALSVEDKELLGGGKVVVIGTDDDRVGLTRVYAQALAQILALPRIKILPAFAQWSAWIIAGLAGTWIVYFVPRKKALIRGTIFIFVALVVCFLAFQSSLIWCPPTIPAALIALSAVFARVAGRRRDLSSEVPLVEHG